MADIALDYGSADPAPTVATMQDDAMMDDFSSAQPQGSRFYALPTYQAIEGGANRGPAPLSAAADTLDDHTLLGPEPTAPVSPDPPAVESGSDIRLETLLITGSPITQLSTSRLFAYLTHYGAQPLGLEWIDDENCKIVFSDERSARLGLEYLCPPPSNYLQVTDEQPVPLPNIETLLEYEPDSWHSEFISSLVTPRRAHRVPGKLYNHVERQAALTELEEQKRAQDAVSSLPDDVPEIYREMEAEEQQKKLNSREVRDLLKLRGTLWLRHAVNDVDRKESRASTKSQWYKRHGFETGREIVPKLLQVGEVRESVELFPNYRPSESQQGDSGRRRALDELDSELDRHVASRGGDDGKLERREGEMMADVVQNRSHRRSRRGDNGDLMDRVHGRNSNGRRRNTDADGGERWGHDAYETLEADSRRSRGSRRSGGNGRKDELEAMDLELEDMQQSRRSHQRELSPNRRGRRNESSYSDSNRNHGGGGGRDDGGRVKVKGRGRMKAPGFDDRWGNDDAEKGSLAKRMGGGDLLGRLGGGGSGSGGSLADRFS